VSIQDTECLRWGWIFNLRLLYRTQKMPPKKEKKRVTPHKDIKHRAHNFLDSDFLRLSPALSQLLPHISLANALQQCINRQTISIFAPNGLLFLTPVSKFCLFPTSFSHSLRIFACAQNVRFVHSFSALSALSREQNPAARKGQPRKQPSLARRSNAPTEGETMRRGDAKAFILNVSMPRSAGARI
jgi:hypothetical protein